MATFTLKFNNQTIIVNAESEAQVRAFVFKEIGYECTRCVVRKIGTEADPAVVPVAPHGRGRPRKAAGAVSDPPFEPAPKTDAAPLDFHNGSAPQPQ